MKRFMMFFLAVFLIIVYGTLASAAVEGTWTIQSTETTKLKIHGHGSENESQSVTSTWIFQTGGIFDGDDVKGTWSQDGKKFTVSLDTAQLADSIEADLSADGYNTTVTVTTVSFTGKEQKNGTISGKYKFKADIIFNDLATTGTINIKGNFTGSLSQTQIVSGNITEDTTWSGQVLLRGAVFILPPATLTIQPGTTIYGETASIGTLIIAQGAKINAVGTQAAPIVFTSEQPEGLKARSDWGGLIINGNAPLNVPGGIAYGEGDTGVYGGNDPNDNSGTLRYVRVEYAGHEFSPENELNGIAFQGVGAGTTVDHVQVHMNKDDGIECFGGTVNFKYVIVTNIGDDCFDWTDGWQGKAQFLIAQQRGDDADNGFEADNNQENEDYAPRSNPTIYNVTLVGDPTANYGTESDLGMLLRHGTAAKIYNAIVVGFKDKGLEIDHATTFAQAQAGNLIVDNSIFYNCGPGGTLPFSDDSDEKNFTPPFTTEYFATTMMDNNATIDPMLVNPYDHTNPDFRPASGSPAVNGTVPVATPPNDGFFEQVTFIGGVDPDNDWTAGWTVYE
ncbi:MAG: T9SS C-terminal target domain-containing protein [Nitrospirae bacterium]|nr:T9SS C-terminal target domain-containing protein [Nitrospirota bacterium]